MVELKSLITLSIFLFSYPPSFASPEAAANPDPQWRGAGSRNGDDRPGLPNQSGGGWRQPPLKPPQQQEGPQWGVGPNPNPRQGSNPPYPKQNPRPGNNGGYPQQNPRPGYNPAWPQPAPKPAGNPAWPQQTPQPDYNQPVQNAPNWTPPQAQPQAQPQAPPQAAPQPPSPTHDPDDDEPSGPKWTPPPNWGPRTTPFGPPKPPTLPQPQVTPPAPFPPKPKPTTRPDYCTNTDLICTTTIDEPKEPIPYAVTCGKSRFNEYDVSNALNTGCYYYKKNGKINNTEFPKIFENSKGRFDFGTIKGPFMEFPLIDSAAYISGPAGAHRVVFSVPDCFLAGEVTTEGARGGAFTECTEEF